jgi:hypothetical protein
VIKRIKCVVIEQIRIESTLENPIQIIY